MDAEIRTVSGQCGMRTIVDLYSEYTLEEQIDMLQKAFADSDYGGSRGASQVLITDVTSSEKNTWAETKAHAYHGPVTVNPNTGNRIKVYICTKETLKELKDLLPKGTKKKKK